MMILSFRNDVRRTSATSTPSCTNRSMVRFAAEVLSVPAERSPGSALIPLHNGVGLQPSPEIGVPIRIGGVARPAVQDQHDGIGAILPTDGHPLFDATNLQVFRFVDAIWRRDRVVLGVSPAKKSNAASSFRSSSPFEDAGSCVRTGLENARALNAKSVSRRLSILPLPRFRTRYETGLGHLLLHCNAA